MRLAKSHSTTISTRIDVPFDANGGWYTAHCPQCEHSRMWQSTADRPPFVSLRRNCPRCGHKPIEWFWVRISGATTTIEGEPRTESEAVNDDDEPTRPR